MRYEPVFVDTRAASAAPQHVWMSSPQPGVYIMRPEQAGERTPALHRELHQTLLEWWPNVVVPTSWVLDYRHMDRWQNFREHGDKFAEFAKKVAPLAEGKIVCHAVVARDELALGALRTMFWHDQLRFPRRFFCDFDEAVAWVSKQITSTPR